MAYSNNTFTDTLNGNFKEKYGDKVENLIPEGLKALTKVSFAPRKSLLGNLYHQPVILSHEQGLTFAGPTDDAFNLNAPVAGYIADAQVRGSQIMLRSVMGIAAAQRSVNGGDSAFEDSTKLMVKNMLQSIQKCLEVLMFHGSMGLATVASSSGNVLTITTAEWAPGIWSGAENMPIEVRDSSGVLRGTTSVTAVDLSARTVTVAAKPAGTVSTDVLWRMGAYGNEFAGFHKMITNTGTLFNISAASYNLFKGNTHTLSPTGTLDMADIQDAIALSVAKGLDESCTVFVNVKTWVDLLTEQTALRSFDSSYSSASLQNGAQELVFFGQNGKVEVIPSIYVKEGYAYVLCLPDFIRIGSTDVTFKRPGKPDEYFRELENSAGFELRAYTDQALFSHAIGKNSLIAGIVN